MQIQVLFTIFTFTHTNSVFLNSFPLQFTFTGYLGAMQVVWLPLISTSVQRWPIVTTKLLSAFQAQIYFRCVQCRCRRIEQIKRSHTGRLGSVFGFRVHSLRGIWCGSDELQLCINASPQEIFANKIKITRYHCNAYMHICARVQIHCTRKFLYAPHYK